MRLSLDVRYYYCCLVCACVRACLCRFVLHFPFPIYTVFCAGTLITSRQYFVLLLFRSLCFCYIFFTVLFRFFSLALCMSFRLTQCLTLIYVCHLSFDAGVTDRFYFHFFPVSPSLEIIRWDLWASYK